MNQFFSIGELSKLQNISRQTLIYYDKIGLFCPSYVDPDNGYRYYSWSQLDSLDTILIMKKIG
ncbi:MAG: MerR family DNA-binding transcriptional regulator, partial [Clostridium sp.]